MVVHDGHKYVFHPGAFDELYDLERDPAELHNLIDSEDKAAVLRECRRRMLEAMARTHDSSQRAFFLFADPSAYGGTSVSAYDPNAGNMYWDRPPVLRGD